MERLSEVPQIWRIIALSVAGLNDLSSTYLDLCKIFVRVGAPDLCHERKETQHMYWKGSIDLPIYIHNLLIMNSGCRNTQNPIKSKY